MIIHINHALMWFILLPSRWTTVLPLMAPADQPLMRVRF